MPRHMEFKEQVAVVLLILLAVLIAAITEPDTPHGVIAAEAEKEDVPADAAAAGVDRGRYIVDTDETSGYTEIVVKNLDTGAILDESDMTPPFYERVQAAKARLARLRPWAGQIKKATQEAEKQKRSEA